MLNEYPWSGRKPQKSGLISFKVSLANLHIGALEHML